MSKGEEVEIQDADILFLYDVKLANPNGDPDEENRPRIDEVTRKALVSDVRLKRYLRDYWLDNGRDVWVRKLDAGETTTASARLKGLAEECAVQRGKKVELKKADKEFLDWLLDRLIDVRLFGATMPIAGDEEGEPGGTRTFTGPVQFSWGYSLHPVELVLSSGITSQFAGREKGEKGRYGTMGKDWRLHYALIAFHGHVSKARARWTSLKQDDLEKLEEALLHAIPHQATSRSKLGQVPRLYLNVRYKNRPSMMGDLRDYILLEPSVPAERIRSTLDYRLNLKPLVERLKKEEIAEVRFWKHHAIQLNGTEKGLETLPGFRAL